MFEQKFAFSLVVFLFTCGSGFLFDFFLFVRFFGLDFLNGFPNLFIVLSRSSFLFSQ